jgi:hypothetical protein
MNKPMLRASVLALALGLSACGGGGGASLGTPGSLSAPAAATEARSGVDLAVTGHFDRLNEVRSQLGIAALRWNGALSNAAQNHAEYLRINQSAGHEETAGAPGFTGTSIADRVRAMGYPGMLVQETKAGGQSVSGQQGRDRMDALLLAPLHRLQLLAPEFDEAGVGAAAQGGALVTNLGASSVRVQFAKGRLMFPNDGHAGIAPSFRPGSEEGLPATLPVTTGTPLTLSGSLFASISYSSTSLVDDDSKAEVPLVPLVPVGATQASLMFFPAQPLRANARYVWQITATVDGITATTRARFTTGG